MESHETSPSASYLDPSALRIRLKWDVFLSFRGEDTRKTFTKNLYHSLLNAGVRTFLDDDGMERGDEVGPSLVQAIEDSAAAVAVISQNYADSRWCLEELCKFIEHRRFLLPVFYGVNPSDVRRQTGIVGEGLDRLRVKSRENDIKRWREALTKAGDMPGFIFVESEEAQLRQSIVERVQTELNNAKLRVAAYAVGLDSRVKRVLDMLDVQSNRFRVLGIHGIPGVGKTTLAKAAFNTLEAYFKRCCFISNVNETWEVEGLVGVQKKILGHLSESLVNTEDDGGIALRFRRMAHEDRVLVVLDDVSDAKLLESLQIERNSMDKASRIIVASRDREVLLAFADDDLLYEVQELDFNDSLELFSYHSLRRKKPTEDFYDLCKEFVESLGRLPLALEVFGSYLLDKRTSREWEECLKILRGSDLGSVLQISIDGLDMEEKCIFLDISCLLIQMEMKTEDVIDIFECCGFHPRLAIRHLIARSLLKITDQNTFWMHDKVRDMGRQIDKINSGGPSRLWDMKSIMSALNDKQGRSVRGLVLGNGKRRLPRECKDETISGSNIQRVPNIENTTLSLWEKLREYFLPRDDNFPLCINSFKPMLTLKLLQINYAEVEGDFGNMPAELRWLQWKGCPLKSFPSSIPRELRVLDLSESNIEFLWYRSWWPLGHHKVADNLSVINLYGCCNLTAIPDLSGHQNLKKLILEGCTKLTKLHESIGNLTSLVHLNLKRCSSLVQLPADVSGLKSLEEFSLSECSELRKLPDDVRSLKSLVQLFADRTAISKLPEFLFRLTKLEVLNLDHCKLLNCLPSCIKLPISLKDFSLVGSGLESLPDSIQALRSLKILNLSGCTSLATIPESVGKLKSLKELSLGGSSVNCLPSSVFSLPYLQVFSAVSCSSLLVLPASIQGLSSVVELHLSKTPISKLPDDIGSLKVIKKLDVSYCTSLTSLPESIVHMWSLTTLLMARSSITELPESIDMLDNLILLDIRGCKQLHKVPNSLGKLKSLHLKMEDTDSFRLLSSPRVLSRSIT